MAVRDRKLHYGMNRSIVSLVRESLSNWLLSSLPFKKNPRSQLAGSRLETDHSLHGFHQVRSQLVPPKCAPGPHSEACTVAAPAGDQHGGVPPRQAPSL